MINRRRFLLLGSVLAVWPYGCTTKKPKSTGIRVNDIHSQLNATIVNRIENVDSIESIRNAINIARREDKAICIAGSRHAMGAQQFATDAVLVDMTNQNQVLDFDTENGIIEVGAGIEWPELVEYLQAAQEGQPRQWGINQKQTGTDRLSIGGALAANAHSRGLLFKPFIQDVESFILIDAEGNELNCSRDENSELFKLAIGGYGLFGVIATGKLRLARRVKLERVVEIIDIKDLTSSFDERIEDGFLFGDFQFSTDIESDDLFRKGVFACYKPVADTTPIAESQKKLAKQDWSRLTKLAHIDRNRAFLEYSTYYLSTAGQIYWSDLHQMSSYTDNYHELIDQQLGREVKGSEMITEIYVPRNKLADFSNDVRRDFQEHDVNLIYGTIRLIEKDDESFLAWAKESWACTIFNLHVDHSEAGKEKAAIDFRRLIDRAIKYGGSYFLTYHKWASRKQVETCYPQFVEFLRLKRKYDPQERFQSDWYRHYKEMFADVL